MISLTCRARSMLCHPVVLGLPALHVVIGNRPNRIGPMLNWLHWSVKQSCGYDDGGEPQRQRLLRITLCGYEPEQFINRFLDALVQVRIFLIVFGAEGLEYRSVFFDSLPNNSDKIFRDPN